MRGSRGGDEFMRRRYAFGTKQLRKLPLDMEMKCDDSKSDSAGLNFAHAALLMDS